MKKKLFSLFIIAALPQVVSNLRFLRVQENYSTFGGKSLTIGFSSVILEITEGFQGDYVRKKRYISAARENRSARTRPLGGNGFFSVNCRKPSAAWDKVDGGGHCLFSQKSVEWATWSIAPGVQQVIIGHRRPPTEDKWREIKNDWSKITMKKIVNLIFSLVLICAIFVPLGLSASAAEMDAVMPASLEDGIGAAAVTSSSSSGLPFTITAAHVTSFLSSKASGKSFVPKNYTSASTINVDGKLTHSLSYGAIRSGICYYDSSLGYYVPGVYQDTISDEDIFMYVNVTDLYLYKTYYGYIRNDAGSGYVNGGSITVSCANG